MRHPATVLLFIVCVASAAGALAASGASMWMDVSPSSGVQDDVDEHEETLSEDYTAGRQEGETSFVGATISGVDKVVGSFVLIFVLQDLLMNNGLPGWAATFLASPLAWSFGLFMIYMISGRQNVRPR